MRNGFGLSRRQDPEVPSQLQPPSHTSNPTPGTFTPLHQEPTLSTAPDECDQPQSLSPWQLLLGLLQSLIFWLIPGVVA